MMVYTLCGVFSYGLVSQLESDCSKIKNEYKLCGTMTPFQLPVKVSPFMVKIIYILQIFAGVLALVPGALIYCTCFEAADILIYHLIHLKSKIHEFFEHKDSQSNIREIVLYHRYIIG